MSDLTDQEIDDAIWPPALIFYFHAMSFNVGAALASLEVAGNSMGLTPGSDSPETIDQDFVLNHLQNAIIHAGAVSRHFWPPKGKGAAARKKQARGAFLRRQLGIEDASPLADRRLRNAIEHFDERLDAYVGQGIVGIILPHYVGESMEASGIPGHIFRAFYTDSLTFEIMSERYEIAPLIDELQRLENLLESNGRGGSPNKRGIPT
jgi:hypothetical protein